MMSHMSAYEIVWASVGFDCLTVYKTKSHNVQLHYIAISREERQQS